MTTSALGLVPKPKILYETERLLEQLGFTREAHYRQNGIEKSRICGFFYAELKQIRTNPTLHR